MKTLDLIVYGFDPWSSMWKRTQMLVAKLAEKNHVGQILYINPSLHLMDMVRSPGLLRTTATREAMQYLRAKRVLPNVTVYTPLLLPLMYQGKALAGLRRYREIGRAHV